MGLDPGVADGRPLAVEQVDADRAGGGKVITMASSPIVPDAEGGFDSGFDFGHGGR